MTTPVWVKAAASGSANCPEVAWVTAARCSTGGRVQAGWVTADASGGTNCVEAQGFEGGVLVRDSKDPAGPVLWFTAAEWEAFSVGMVAGEFTLDRLQAAAVSRVAASTPVG